LNLLTVKQATSFFSRSESWVRRHLAELSIARIGGSIFIDVSQLEGCTIVAAKSLNRKGPGMVTRFQRGFAKYNKKTGFWDVRFRLDLPDGTRKQRRIRRFGTRAEYPDKNSVEDEIRARCKREQDAILCQAQEKAEAAIGEAREPVTFKRLVDRWEASDGATLGESSMGHYRNAADCYVAPEFGDTDIKALTHETLQLYLNEQAKSYSRSSVKSMRIALKLVLAFAVKNKLIDMNPAENLKTPKRCGGRKVTRTILVWSQIVSMLTVLEDPYRTLILFLSMVPKRIEEAIALRPTDLDVQNVLHVRRVLYEGKVIELEPHEQEHIPLDAPVHADLVKKLRELGGDHEWIFRSKNGQPLNVGNARRRKLHPAAAKAGVKVGGFHDFRHTMSSAMRKAGVDLKVRSAVLGHKGKIGVLAHDVYDGVKPEEIRRALVQGAQWMMREESMQQALLASSELFPRMFPTQGM
jgi:integrase